MMRSRKKIRYLNINQERLRIPAFMERSWEIVQNLMGVYWPKDVFKHTAALKPFPLTVDQDLVVLGPYENLFNICSLQDGIPEKDRKVIKVPCVQLPGRRWQDDECRFMIVQSLILWAQNSESPFAKALALDLWRDKAFRSAIQNLLGKSTTSLEQMGKVIGCKRRTIEVAGRRLRDYPSRESAQYFNRRFSFWLNMKYGMEPPKRKKSKKNKKGIDPKSGKPTATEQSEFDF